MLIQAIWATEAADIAKDLIEKGYIVAIGLAQLSSRNLKRLGLTVEQALDPCINLRSGGQILTEFYERALKR
jgi:type IV secretion system protein VirB1